MGILLAIVFELVLILHSGFSGSEDSQPTTHPFSELLNI